MPRCTNLLGRFVNRRDRLGPFLVKIFGIGLKRSRTICLPSGLRYNQLISPTPLKKIRYLEQIVRRVIAPEFMLRRQVNANLFFKYSNGSLAGQRLAQGLPSRLQRSKTNAQTAKRLKVDFSKLS